MFWIISLLILLLAGLLSLAPLLGKGSNWKMATLAGIFLMPLAIYGLYQLVGTPQGLDPMLTRPQAASQGQAMGASPSADGKVKTDMATLTEGLRQRLEQNPDDYQGWVLLGRSYKNLQNYPLAVEALEKADSMQPGNPLVQVELVEARLFASGQQRITPEMVAALEKAVAQDPAQQKGLWLLGIAAAQAGDDSAAIGWWEKLLAQIEPGSSIEQTVRSQLDEARTRLGLPPEATTIASLPPQVPAAPAMAPATVAPPPAASGWKGVEVKVELAALAAQDWPQLPAGAVPQGAVLFVIVRPQGAAGGPPLGAHRVSQPQFPLQLSLTDKDSMMAQRPISSASGLELQARLALDGRPMAAAGDWQSVATPVARDATESITLVLDQKL
jgi:cytochrome c-type biogenesis protein CcmH